MVKMTKVTTTANRLLLVIMLFPVPHLSVAGTCRSLTGVAGVAAEVAAEVVAVAVISEEAPAATAAAATVAARREHIDDASVCKYY